MIISKIANLILDNEEFIFEEVVEANDGEQSQESWIFEEESVPSKCILYSIAILCCIYDKYLHTLYIGTAPPTPAPKNRTPTTTTPVRRASSTEVQHARRNKKSK